MVASAHPVSPTERVDLLDALRGVAIFGILIANMLVVSGYVFMDPPARAALSTASSDGPVLYLIHVLVEGKFYSIFSLLFGIGFAVQFQRAEAQGMAFAPHFRRRLLGLFLIGLIHATMIWSGDILMLYALLGLLLVRFRATPDRTLLRGAVFCLALPVLLYLPLLALAGGGPPGPPPAESGPGADMLATVMEGFRSDRWIDSWRSNAMFLVGRWIDLIVTMRFPKVFGMFLLGLYIGRRGAGLDLFADRVLLRRVAVWGLVLGLPANAVMGWLYEQQVYLPPSPLGLLETVTGAIGLPALALGYSALVALAYHTVMGKRVLGQIAYAGRMALSNYLLHSVVMIIVFYGWGLGWYGKAGPAVTTPLALLICVVQVPLSRLWLSRFRYGPVEWLWRQFTYRRRIVLRHQMPAT